MKGGETGDKIQTALRKGEEGERLALFGHKRHLGLSGFGYPLFLILPVWGKLKHQPCKNPLTSLAPTKKRQKLGANRLN